MGKLSVVGMGSVKNKWILCNMHLTFPILNSGMRGGSLLKYKE